MPSEARQKKIMEKLNRAQKCSILEPQNLGSRGGAGPPAPPWIRTWFQNLHNSLPTAREGNVFTGLCHSVHNQPHGYSVTAHPCNGAVDTHPTGCFLVTARRFVLSLSGRPQYGNKQAVRILL